MAFWKRRRAGRREETRRERLRGIRLGAGPLLLLALMSNGAPPVTTAAALTTGAIPPTPLTVASSWMMPPQSLIPASSSPIDGEALNAAAEISMRHGVRFVFEGQDWGDSATAQRTNVAEVGSALDLLPRRILDAASSVAGGSLTFLSNRQGLTLASWQPYADPPSAFYTNSDWSPGGEVASNQVVLQPGSPAFSVAHEVLHAYQFRDTPLGRYAEALLGGEMRSFMAATGWRQVGTDGDVLEAASQPWDALNALYVYEGRPLTYLGADGSAVTLNPPNPLEAFATLGAIYYTYPALPEWPEYWAWFAEHLG